MYFKSVVCGKLIISLSMDYKDEQHNEIEALESIYCGELESTYLVENSNLIDRGQTICLT